MPAANAMFVQLRASAEEERGGEDVNVCSRKRTSFSQELICMRAHKPYARPSRWIDDSCAALDEPHR